MTEKTTHEQNAAQRQVELLSDALERAKTNGGVLRNAVGKTAAQFYGNESQVSPFNALTMALHSDANGYKTNLYTLFNDAKKRGEAVQTGQKGVPFIWYLWKEYQSKANPEEKISREDYNKLPQEKQGAYKPLREREVRTLFNIEQTTMPASNKKAYEEAVQKNGSEMERGFSESDDRNRRIMVNDMLLKVKDNLVTVRKDGTGVAHYDSTKDIVHIPAQKHYASYADYVQESLRQIVTATGHPQRLGRHGMAMEGANPASQEAQQRERFVVELASAVKMNQMGMPGKISDEGIKMIDDWKAQLKDNPRFIDAIEADINSALGMIAKAERGEKVELKPADQVAKADVDYATVAMLRDDEGKWAIYLKPEGEKGFSVYPDKEDINRFFVTVKQGNTELTDRVREGMAQKYYVLSQQHPEMKKDLFYGDVPKEERERIQHVTIFRSKDSKLLLLPTIQDLGKVRPREITQAQWQRLWLSEDMAEYKSNLAATVFSDVLRGEKKQEQDQSQTQTQTQTEVKAQEQKPVKEKEANDSINLESYNSLKAKHPDAVLLFRTNDNYESYKNDAEVCAKVLGIDKEERTNAKTGEKVAITTFPYHQLDTYLPKLVRAGNRVAICDQLEAPKQQAKQEAALPLTQQKQEETSRGFHR